MAKFSDTFHSLIVSKSIHRSDQFFLLLPKQRWQFRKKNFLWTSKNMQISVRNKRMAPNFDKKEKANRRGSHALFRKQFHPPFLSFSGNLFLKISFFPGYYVLPELVCYALLRHVCGAYIAWNLFLWMVAYFHITRCKRWENSVLEYIFRNKNIYLYF